MTLPFTTEKQFAISAVRRASYLTRSVFNKLVKHEALTKDDKSPVTVGDYAAQAVISSMLHNAYPKDFIIGEEDAAELREESGRTLGDRIVELANEALTLDLEEGELREWGIGPGQTKSADELLDAIDRGNHLGGRTGRLWTIDPIDGTKGFLRKEQYAVCLALIVDGQVQVGVIGCPNLPASLSNPESERGWLFVAVRGQGAIQMPLDGNNNTKTLSMPPYDPASYSFLESVEAAHSSHSTSEKVSAVLGISHRPIRMDSQAKYCCLARGDGGAYVRISKGDGYIEKIWDHAPGSLLVEESGGVVSDSLGNPLDFGLGRTLGENMGLVATVKDAHARLIDAVAKAQS